MEPRGQSCTFNNSSGRRAKQYLAVFWVVAQSETEDAARCEFTRGADRIDPDSKLVPTWFVGTRDAGAAYHFIHDLASRMAMRLQLTTDGHRAYLSAVEDAFGGDIDYAMLHKIYGKAPEGPETRYSPAQCMGARKAVISGAPEWKHVSTSRVERQNLTMRMSMRRFTRLTNGFSKKVENHEHSIAVHYMFYNFGRIHQTLRVTPAMEAGISDHVWTMEEIVGLLD